MVCHLRELQSADTAATLQRCHGAVEDLMAADA